MELKNYVKFKLCNHTFYVQANIIEMVGGVEAFMAKSNYEQVRLSDFVVNEDNTLIKCRYMLEDLLDATLTNA